MTIGQFYFILDFLLSTKNIFFIVFFKLGQFFRGIGVLTRSLDPIRPIKAQMCFPQKKRFGQEIVRGKIGSLG